MSTTARKTTKTRREQIVLAVLDIIGEQGLTSLTTSTLAERVGVTTGALFRHFPSRDAMLDAVVDYGIARIQETFPDDDLGALERLFALAENRVALLASNKGLAWLLRSEQVFLTIPEGSIGKLRKVMRRSKRFLLDALTEAQANRDIRNDIDVKDLLVIAMGTIHALIGMPGVHGRRAKANQPNRETVLAALKTIFGTPAK